MSDKPIFEQRIEGEVNFGGKDIIERLHGPEIIQQLQQENQALRERFSQLQENFEQERSAHDSDLNELQKQHIRCMKSEIELTRLREALKEIAEAKFSNLGELLKVPEIAREALAPQGTETH